VGFYLLKVLGNVYKLTAFRLYLCCQPFLQPFYGVKTEALVSRQVYHVYGLRLTLDATRGCFGPLEIEQELVLGRESSQDHGQIIKKTGGETRDFF
jgi:hypothetical protein